MNTNISIPEGLPILSAGAHSSPKEGACLLEYASYLAGEEWSDSPACTHPVLARMAQVVNDRLPDSERAALLDLLPRLMGTAETGTEDERRWLSVGLAVWCAEQVVHLAGSAEPQSREAIRVTRSWLAGDATRGECQDATNAAYASYASAASAAYAAYAAAASAANAAYANAANAANAAYAAAVAAAHANGDLVGSLDGLLDEYDRLTGRGATGSLTHADIERLAALTT